MKYPMFPEMAKILKPGTLGRFDLDTFEMTEEDVTKVQLTSMWKGSGEYQDAEPGVYARLMEHGGEIIMTDTIMERRTNKEFYQQAHGNVLIAGLGLGMIIMAIQNKPEVAKITIIEKEPCIIKLVGKQLPLVRDKVEIIEGDIFYWNPPKGIKYDTIYFDIWSNIPNEYDWEDMKVLKRRFRGYKVPSTKGGWIGCWRENDVKRRVRMRGRW